MTMIDNRPTRGSLATLRQLVRARQAVEHCELCGQTIAAEHDHLVEIAARRVVCACQACALLFDRDEAVKYRRVPRRVLSLVDFQLSDGGWDELLIPIGLAFFFRSTAAERVVAMYPSPAGATESLLSLDAWCNLAAANPVLDTMLPDVEALLVNRLGPIRGFAAHQYFLAPIDQCYRLVGLIRARWRGLSGGTEVWQEIQRFFAELTNRSQGKLSPCPT